MIHISQKLMDEVIDYCKNALPEEACGVLYGNERKNCGKIEICEFVGVTNIASDPEQDFLMNPEEWIPLLFESEHLDRQLVGIFHSHPGSTAVPSHQDLTTLWKNIPSYWIISLMHKDHTQLYAYRLLDGLQYEKIPITIKA